MQYAASVFKGASWLAAFKGISQSISWVATIIIARLLLPDDYGLMEKSMIFTGYAVIFSDLGLGAAIIQKNDVSKNELSSIFWFSFIISLLLGIICFFIAYPSAHIFNDSRIIPVTQFIALVFVTGGLRIVPESILKRNLDFKKSGFALMVGTVISCFAMILLAYLGAGVWTLVAGQLVRNIIALVLMIKYSKWFPSLHFDFKEAKNFIKFGIYIAISGTLFYVSCTSDRFFAGRAWDATMLGFYSLALSLSKMPTEKIVVLINQVAFSALSRLKHDIKAFSQLYLQIVKVTAIIILPLFIGLFFTAELTIKLFLDEKWIPIILIFKLLCITQIFSAMNAVNGFVHAALGFPKNSMFFNLAMTIVMPISFYFSVRHGLEAIAIPWLTVYPIMITVWMLITIKKANVSFLVYFKNISPALGASLALIATLLIIGSFNNFFNNTLLFQSLNLSALIIGGAIVYITTLWLLDKNIFEVLFNMIKNKKVGEN